MNLRPNTLGHAMAATRKLPMPSNYHNFGIQSAGDEDSAGFEAYSNNLRRQSVVSQQFYENPAIH